jgi:DNA-binding transcriptional regulator YiaG
MDSLRPDMTECLTYETHDGDDTVTGKELRRLRERAGLSQMALAKLAGIHARTIMRWELGQVPIPKLEALGLVALLKEKKGDARG